MSVRHILLPVIAITLITIAYFKTKEQRRLEEDGEQKKKEQAAVAPSDLKEDLSAEYLQGFGAADSDIRRDLTLLHDALDALINSVKVPGALPTSGNREIVRALAGENAYRIRFIDPSADYINADGEITDRWGSPIYFHFVEANDPGLRSAGPDKTPWTEDDVFHGEFAEEQ